MSKERKAYIISILSLCIVFAFIKGCDSRQADKLLKNVMAYQDTAQQLSLKVNGHIVELASNKSLVLEKESQLKDLLSKNDTLKRELKKFKSLQSVSQITTITKIEHDTIPLLKEIPCDFAPIKIKRDSLWYKFEGTISKKDFTIDKLEIPNRLDIIIGTKKVGLFKREKRIDVIPSNPLVSTSRISNFVIEEKKKIYQRPIVYFIAGAVLGGASVVYLSK